MGGGLVNMHLLYIPTFLSIQILPKKTNKKLKKGLWSLKIGCGTTTDKMMNIGNITHMVGVVGVQ